MRIAILSCVMVLLASACAGRKVPGDCVYPAGVLLFNKDSVSWPVAHVGREYTDTVVVYNPTREAVRLEGFNHFPELDCHKKGESTRDWNLGGYNVGPLSTDTLVVVFRPGDVALLGDYYNVLRFMVNGEVDYFFGIRVETDVRENFEAWDAGEKARAPRLRVDTLEVDFGTLREDEQATVTFTLSNTGGSNLLLRKIETTCGCTAVIPGQRVILPGHTTTLDVTFHPAGRSGHQRKSITLYCNDPQRPRVQLVITGNVEK